jgi:hypothetical protein
MAVSSSPSALRTLTRQGVEVAGLHRFHTFHAHTKAEMAAQIKLVRKGREVAAQLAVVG